MARRVYTDEDRARAAVLLQANQGNVKRTARELDIPSPTVRDWWKMWEAEGYPEAVEAALPAARESFIAEAVEIRFAMLQRLRQKVDADQLNGRELLLGVGILSDKVKDIQAIERAQPQVQVDINLPSAKELAKELAAFAVEAVEAARSRDVEIAEAEWEQAEPKALPPA